MSGVAGQQFRGLAIAKESAWLTAGAYVVPRGLENIQSDAGEEYIPRDAIHFNSVGDRYAGDPGEQKTTLSYEVPIHSGTYTDSKDILEAAFGSEDGISNIAIGAGPNNESQVTYVGGTPSKIIWVNCSDGIVRLVPIKSAAAGTAIFAVKLPVAVTPTAIDNCNERSGGSWSYGLGTSASTFTADLDRRGRPNEIQYRYKGLGLQSLGLMFELRKRLALMPAFRGGTFQRNPAGFVNVTDPDKFSLPFIGFLADVAYQNLAAPAASGKLAIKSISVELAPSILDETGTPGLSGTTNIGSPLLGFTREPGFSSLIKMVVTYPSTVYETEWLAGTARTLFLAFFPGVPGAAQSAAPRFALWFPRVLHAAPPKEVAVDNHIGMELTLQIERDANLERAYAGFTAS